MEGTVLLVSNILFFVFIITGFLWGLRGLKKQGVRFACFVVAVLIAGILTPIISKAIMEIQITYNGVLTPLRDVIVQLLSNVEFIADLMESSPTIQTLIINIPFMLGNVVSFVLLTYIFSLLSWIVYLVIASIINKNNELSVKIDEKPRKFRLLGGLVGAVQGLILCFITFLPFGGIANIVNDIQAQPVVAETEVVETSATAKFLDENLPQEIKDIINAYSKSIVFGTCNVFNMTNNVFNGISSISIEGTKVSLRDEILNITRVYDNVSFLVDFQFNKESVKTLDYDRLNTAVEYVFDSNILKLVLPDLSTYLFDYLEDNYSKYKDVLNAIENDLQLEQGIVENLKSELINLVNSAKLIAQSSIVNQIPFDEQEEFTKQNAIEIVKTLKADENKLFNDLISIVFDSKLVNKALIYALNEGLDYAENYLQTEFDDETIELGNIDITDSQLFIDKLEISEMSDALINLIDVILSVDFDKIKDNYLEAAKYDLPLAVESAGKVMDVVQDMTIFDQTGIYNNIIDCLSDSSYNEYVDFSILKNDNIWISESVVIAKSLKALVESQVINYIEKNSDSYSITESNFKLMINDLLQQTEENGVNKTVARQIVEPIYESKLSKKLVEICLNEVNKIVNDIGKEIDGETELGEFNTAEFYTEPEKQKLLDLIDNVLVYIKPLDIFDLKDDPFNTVMNSDLEQLGKCLNIVKTMELFKAQPNVENSKGVFINLVDALAKTEYSQYVNFECFKDENFNFELEFKNIQPTVELLMSKEITLPDESTIPLMDYILEDGDWDIILSQLSQDDITNIVTPLMNSKMFEPLGVMIINKVNEEIKDVVGEYGDTITSITGNLDEEEIGQIVEVLGDVVEIIEDINVEDFDLTEFATSENSEQLGALLDSLQENANSEGVFANAYDSMVEYVKADETIGESLTDLISKYPEGQIDWTQVLEDLKSLQG